MKVHGKFWKGPEVLACRVLTIRRQQSFIDKYHSTHTDLPAPASKHNHPSDPKVATDLTRKLSSPRNPPRKLASLRLPTDLQPSKPWCVEAAFSRKSEVAQGSGGKGRQASPEIDTPRSAPQPVLRLPSSRPKPYVLDDPFVDLMQEQKKCDTLDSLDPGTSAAFFPSRVPLPRPFFHKLSRLCHQLLVTP
jgi:hypothetical protein